MCLKFDKFVKSIGKAIETTPELYKDAFQPTIQETGKIVARVPRAINAAFSGLDQWILNREYNIDETKKLLAKKLENVEPEKIVTPEPYVAIPAIQALSYTMNSNELHELYATLLAKSMNSDTKDFVHPGYIETIKQLSPDDATYFKHICPLNYRPMISAVLDYPNAVELKIATQINTFSKGYSKNIPLSIDNLSRLGLIEIPSDMWYGDDSLYNELIKIVKKLYPFEQYKEKYPESINMSYPKSRIDITPYGNSFYNICVKS